MIVIKVVRHGMRFLITIIAGAFIGFVAGIVAPILLWGLLSPDKPGL